MITTKHIQMITSTLISEKLEKEVELERLITNGSNTQEFKEKIIGAIRDYRESVSDLQFWESFVQESITTPQDINQNGDNN